jgi:hypothetical protein
VSARSRQAQHLARNLGRAAGIGVRVDYDGGRGYLILWGDGPTAEDMSALVTAELASGQYPDLPARLLSSARGYTARAFAARAAAASRDGSLASAIDAGAATRRQFGDYLPSRSVLSDAEHDALRHIEQLLDVTPYPERAADPADEPVITSLLHASGGNEYKMLPALLQTRRNAEPAPAAAQPGQPAHVPGPACAAPDDKSAAGRDCLGAAAIPGVLDSVSPASPATRQVMTVMKQQHPDRDAERSPYESQAAFPPIVTWTCAELRDRLERNGAALAEVHLAQDEQHRARTAEPWQADREAEP